MRNSFGLLMTLLLISISSCGQSPNKLEVYFHQDKNLKFVLDNNQFKLIDQTTLKSKTSDFTVSGYHLLTGSFDELVSKAKKQLIGTFHTTEKDLFIKKITKPHFEGIIIFATNGKVASSIYIFKVEKGFGWVTMSFNHDQKETEKVDVIIASIQQTK